ncbi:zinc-ribbon domain-containing protein [Marinobacter sediminum]|uniref:DUF3426 domain-containing protein n=1 Tax=Marinobacter sediminum TaxID=256323 RepID=UPI00202E8957|nr:DUF3426 domain-containing protein [Marinobacter sediminum]MCM0613403.1 zinc-ribbon domain-containing protein [Marinobacter sediminum]
MSQSSLQTQCPNCQTRFRVTDEQLGIAKGKVRCGNCMEVFNAIQHQVVPGTAKAATSPATGAQSDGASASTSTSPHPTEENFVFADNPEEDAADGPYAGSKTSFSDDELSDSFRTFDDRAASDFPDADDDTAGQKIDESWAEAILEDNDHSFSAPEARKKSVDPAPKPEPASEERTPGARSHAKHDQPEPARLSARETESGFRAEEETASAPTAADDFFEPFQDEPEYDFDRQDDQRAEPMAATVQFNDLRRDPVAVGGNGSGKLRTVIWTMVVLALAGTLVAQVVWFQFDRLSSIPELRPFYEKGCELAGCKLKPLINVDAIQSRKLVVRTDPDNRSQLLVDAVIINRAAFEQPFPAIALTFSNLNGDIVAQSIFLPEEYLAGEGRNLDAMPRSTPVRIAINIRDPGRDAVNYNINFRSVSP